MLTIHRNFCAVMCVETGEHTSVETAVSFVSETVTVLAFVNKLQWSSRLSEHVEDSLEVLHVTKAVALRGVQDLHVLQ